MLRAYAEVYAQKDAEEDEHEGEARIARCRLRRDGVGGGWGQAEGRRQDADRDLALVEGSLIRDDRRHVVDDSDVGRGCEDLHLEGQRAIRGIRQLNRRIGLAPGDRPGCRVVDAGVEVGVTGRGSRDVGEPVGHRIRDDRMGQRARPGVVEAVGQGVADLGLLEAVQRVGWVGRIVEGAARVAGHVLVDHEGRRARDRDGRVIAVVTRGAGRLIRAGHRRGVVVDLPLPGGSR